MLTGTTAVNTRIDPPLLEDLRLADVTTFLLVRRRGSVTGAARELKVTPSKVSKAIARLEACLKLRLLVRSPRGVTVSDAALRVAPQLEELIAALERVRQGDAPHRMELTMAAPSYLNVAFLPRIVTALPQVRVRGIEAPPAFVRAYATEGIFDAALMPGRERLAPTWTTLEIGRIRRGLFAPPALAAKLGPPPVAPEALLRVPFVGPVYNSNGQFVPGDDGCPIPLESRVIGHESSTIGVALELAARCEQLVFGPLLAALPLIRLGRLVEVSVAGWDVSDGLYLYTNVDRVLSRVQRAIADAVRDEIAHALGQPESASP